VFIICYESPGLLSIEPFDYDHLFVWHVSGRSSQEILPVSSSVVAAQDANTANRTPSVTQRAAKSVASAETTPKKSDADQQESTADLQGTLLRTITQLMHQPQQQVLAVAD
jgi:hypothetical protein